MINNLRGYPEEWAIYPSVTEILPPANFICSPEQLENARIEGERNHKRVERFLNKGSADNLPYIKTFQRFLEEYAHILGKPIQWETPLLSQKYKFKGKPDIIFEKGIVDVKRTFWDAKKHALQLAGYNILTAENQVLKKTKNRFIFVIPKDNQTKYNIYNVWNDQADTIFLALLQQNKIQKEADKKKEELQRAIDIYLQGSR